MPRNAGGSASPRVNLHDVAKAAGVSSQTVSRVVRGTDNVAEATRRKVSRAIQQLGYTPNLAARSLSAGRVGSIHVIVTTPLFHGVAEVFVSLCEALSGGGMAMSSSSAVSVTEGSLGIPISADGVIVLGGFQEAEPWLADVATNLPVVYVGCAAGLPEGVSAVMVDMAAGARMAVEHLVATGRRRLVHIAGPQEWIDSQLRAEGFLSAAQECGIDGHVMQSSTWDGADARHLAAHLDPDADAVFAANDELALGVLAHCHSRGLTVPDDIAVVGFDNTPSSAAFWPALTTVDQVFRDQGMVAAREITRLLHHEPARVTVLQPKLIVRQSA